MNHCRINPIPTWTDLDLGFMVGWLEGEGTFLHHSLTGQTSIQGLCTDQDTISKVCKLLSANIRSSPTKNRIHKKVWRFSISGPRAIEAMIRVYPYMSDRRKLRIEEILGLWEHGT